MIISTTYSLMQCEMSAVSKCSLGFDHNVLPTCSKFLIVLFFLIKLNIGSSLEINLFKLCGFAIGASACFQKMHLLLFIIMSFIC